MEVSGESKDRGYNNNGSHNDYNNNNNSQLVVMSICQVCCLVFIISGPHNHPAREALLSLSYR